MPTLLVTEIGEHDLLGGRRPSSSGFAYRWTAGRAPRSAKRQRFERRRAVVDRAERADQHP